jgi:hypothetical protein
VIRLLEVHHPSCALRAHDGFGALPLQQDHC